MSKGGDVSLMLTNATPVDGGVANVLAWQDKCCRSGVANVLAWQDKCCRRWRKCYIWLELLSVDGRETGSGEIVFCLWERPFTLELMRVFQLLHHPGARTPVATQISYSPDIQSKGDERLEEALEEENLKEVEAKIEQ
ncbi:hypothetical protein LR48_Vigan05g118500 [Vigna angularis]|uniref:Uncharacterized protein n=1 Tax=Phaseolus angularis TaxID=3914 RepID=A0A0L9UL18_PHAAN|nr:hypothetical protein LR48_Vigan05g118500 [Vigna angularis]